MRLGVFMSIHLLRRWEGYEAITLIAMGGHDMKIMVQLKDVYEPHHQTLRPTK